ncbi:MAG: hypothetical protein O3A00_29080 [Planctomycetota bacterium]|nr:hypothetical protein [Planctomycetota bacterium]
MLTPRSADAQLIRFGDVYGQPAVMPMSGFDPLGLFSSRSAVPFYRSGGYRMSDFDSGYRMSD